MFIQSITMFDIKTESKDQDELTFVIKDVDLSIVNGLRRTLLADIPVAAIRFHPNNANNPDVNFITNTCDLHNEILGQRLSLIPIKMSYRDIESYNRDKYKLVINEKNKDDELMDITTSHIKIYDVKGVKVQDDVHARIFPPDPITKDHCLITKLKPNHYDKANGGELHVEAWISIGTAKEWAGYSAVSLATFEYVVDEQAANAALATRIAHLPASKVKDITHNFNCLDKYRYYKKNAAGDPTDFIFNIESTCGVPCRMLVSIAFGIIIKQLEQLVSGNGKLQLDAKKASNNMFVFMVHGANHTIGSILQAHIYGQRDVVAYVGYNMPHPLEESIVLKLAFVNGGKMAVDEALVAMRGFAKASRDVVASYKKEWDTQMSV